MADDLQAAVAAGVAGSEGAHRELLQSVVEVARAIFAARAASIFLLDEATDELVFEAVAGHGESSLVGNRFPSSRGIAGWVLVTRQPIAIEDPASDKRFASEVADSTGYLPGSCWPARCCTASDRWGDRGARPAGVAAGLGRRSRHAGAVRQPGGDRARPDHAQPAGGRRRGGEATAVVSLAAAVDGWTARGGTPPTGWSRRWRSCSTRARAGAADAPAQPASPTGVAFMWRLDVGRVVRLGLGGLVVLPRLSPMSLDVRLLVRAYAPCLRSCCSSIDRLLSRELDSFHQTAGVPVSSHA